MADFLLEAQPRTVVGKKVSQVRAKGLVPATVYGPKTPPVSIQIPYRPLQVCLMKAGGTNLIDIKVNGHTHTVLAREVQRDVLRGDILHVDFFAVDLAAKVTAQVPIQLVGESPAVASRVGILLSGTNTITIETLPDRLLNMVQVDITELKEIGDGILVGDLALGDEITILNDPEEMIVRVSQPAAVRAAEEEAEEELGEEISPEVEVIERERDEDEE